MRTLISDSRFQIAKFKKDGLDEVSVIDEISLLRLLGCLPLIVFLIDTLHIKTQSLQLETLFLGWLWGLSFLGCPLVWVAAVL